MNSPSAISRSAGTPSVLFVCVRNAGKSQMAAALLRRAAGDRIAVHSAGTHPGPQINALSAQVIAEVGADMTSETPRPIDPALLTTVDLVVVLGREATLEMPSGVELRTWDTDEPSERGIDGIARMRLVRDDIDTRVHALLHELAPPPPSSAQASTSVDESGVRGTEPAASPAASSPQPARTVNTAG